MEEMIKCKFVYVECADGCTDRFIECELGLYMDGLYIKEGDTIHWFSKDCLKYLQFKKKESDTDANSN